MSDIIDFLGRVQSRGELSAKQKKYRDKMSTAQGKVAEQQKIVRKETDRVMRDPDLLAAKRELQARMDTVDEVRMPDPLRPLDRLFFVASGLSLRVQWDGGRWRVSLDHDPDSGCEGDLIHRKAYVDLEKFAGILDETTRANERLDKRTD